MSVAWVGAGIAAVGAVSGYSASKSASNAQAGSAAAANDLQREQYNQTRADNAPFRDAGLAAQNQLMMYLGLTPTSGYTGGKTAAGGYSSGGTDPASIVTQAYHDYLGRDPEAGITQKWQKMMDVGMSADQIRQAISDSPEAQQPHAGWQDPAASPGQPGTSPASQDDPRFGSLMKDFSMADYQADPGYQFRLQQGEQGLTRAGAASGLLGSGKYLKDAMKFNSGLASQEYGAAFDRFQVNRTNKLNPLQSLMGIGQTSTNALNSAGANYASNVGNNLTGAGNARAAGYVGGANAVNGAMGSGWNMYQNQQYLNKLPNNGTQQPAGYAAINDDGYGTGTGPSYNGTYSRM